MIYKFILWSLMAKILEAVPDIKHLDIYDNQPNRGSQNLGYDLPAIFIEFRPVDWVQRASNSRRALMTMIFHIETNREGTSTAANTPESQKAKGLKMLDIMEALFLALQGYTQGNTIVGFGKLVNVTDTLDMNETSTRVDMMAWQCQAVDNSGMPSIRNVLLGQSIAVATNPSITSSLTIIYVA